MDSQQAGHGDTIWADAEARYQPGLEVRGRVTRVAQFGVFVQVEPGIEGVIYAFELGQKSSAVVGFAPGQELQLYVKSVDASRKRLELSLQNEVPPGLLEKQELPPLLRLSKKSEPGGDLSWLPPFPLSGALQDREEQRCPGCQRPVQASWKYCVYCGGSLRRSCSACGTLQPELTDARYCCECGKLLS